MVSDEDGTWSGSLHTDTVVDEWPCRAGLIGLDRSGRLLSCWLAADHLWQGRLVPAGTLMGYGARGDGLPLVLPPEGSMDFPEIGIVLPGGTSLTLDADGLLRSAYLARDAPLRVGDVSLWNTVRWTYPPEASATEPGRVTPRAPIAASGALLSDIRRFGRTIPADTTVSVSLTDGSLIIR